MLHVLQFIRNDQRSELQFNVASQVFIFIQHVSPFSTSTRLGLSNIEDLIENSET